MRKFLLSFSKKMYLFGGDLVHIQVFLIITELTVDKNYRKNVSLYIGDLNQDALYIVHLHIVFIYSVFL